MCIHHFPERLFTWTGFHITEVEIRDPSDFGNWLHDALQEVADPVSGACLGREEECFWVALLGMLRYPCIICLYMHWYKKPRKTFPELRDAFKNPN